jgi:hypothetical protein
MVGRSVTVSALIVLVSVSVTGCSATRAPSGNGPLGEGRPTPVSAGPTVSGDAPCQGPAPFAGVATRKPPEPLRSRDRVPGLGPFAGEWFHHAAHLELRPDGRGTQSFTDNNIGVKVQSLRWTRYRQPDRLVLVVTGQRWENGKGSPIPAPTPGECSTRFGATRPGDSDLLLIEAPHLAKVIPLLSHDDAYAAYDFYWCQDGLSARYDDPKYCGL